jgi:hypothetical protein
MENYKRAMVFPKVKPLRKGNSVKVDLAEN